MLEREESKWVQRDTLSRLDVSGSDMSVAEARMAELLRNHLRQAIQTPPAAK